jgi:hypothetical protein
MNFGQADDDVAVPPSYAFMQVNSKDRNLSNSQTSSFATAAGGDRQPWNNFLVQKPGYLLQSFARRIGVVEVNFPWGIPNVTSANNTFTILNQTTTTSHLITVPVGFYSGSTLATAVNAQIAAVITTDTPTVAWSSSTNSFTISANGGSYLLSADPSGVTTNVYFYSNANLLKTMGFSLAQTNFSFSGTQTLQGSATQILYTQYVDIVSDKLHYNNEVQDGSSSNIKSQVSVLCRIFCSDESSNNTMTTGQAPFVIHRQFRNPKMLKWNSNAMVDWFQIQVYDEYGNLVQLPAAVSTTGTTNASYPDFQLVILATEN